jgi:hypothetical protein
MTRTIGDFNRAFEAGITTYGPWSATVPNDERFRQLRCLAGIAAVMLGSAHPLTRKLRLAEDDAMSFVRAQELLNMLPALTRRRLLSIFSAVTWPPKPKETTR